MGTREVIEWAEYRDLLDRRIRSWLADAPGRLAADAARPFEVDGDRFRGRYLVLGVAGVGGEPSADRSVSAAASVELLYGQALLNARATGLGDTGVEGLNRTRALLASDYLHALGYAGLERIEAEPSISEACYRSLSAASQRLAACWTRVQDDGIDSVDAVPIDPIVTATAGDLAGILGRADDESRRALRTTGAMVGLERWRAAGNRIRDDRTGLLEELLPGEWPRDDGHAFETVRPDDLLAPLPDSNALSRLQSLVDSISRSQTERLTHE